MGQANPGPASSVAGQDTLSYLNQQAPATVLRVRAQRNPTTLDRRYKIGTIWINEVTNQVWMLTSVVVNLANWESLAIGGGNAPISLFVVAADGTGDYTTIQAAINAAAGSDANIWIRPGTYTEDLVMTDGIALIGASGQFGAAKVTIAGTHTPPDAGEITFQDLSLTDATAIVSSAAAGTTTITFQNCDIAVTGGFCCTLLNWTGNLGWQNCGFRSGTNDGVTNNTGGANQFIFNSVMGAGTVNTWVVSGNLESESSFVRAPINFVTGSTANFINSTVFEDPVTFSNDSAGSIYNSSIISGASAAITMSSSGNWELSELLIDSTAIPAIAGAGAGNLGIGELSFSNTGNTLAGTLTIVQRLTRTGSLSSIGDARVDREEAAGLVELGSFNLAAGDTSEACVRVSTQTGDSFIYFEHDGPGVDWSSGSQVTTNDYVIAEDLGLTNNIYFRAVQSTGDIEIPVGNLSITGAARQLRVESGAATDSIGNAVLVAGTVTVANTNINANDAIFLSRSTTGGTEGTLSYTINAGVSFTINSSSAADTSTIEYFIVRKL